jgi:hypothetical protein
MGVATDTGKRTSSSRIECPKWESSRPDGNHGSAIKFENAGGRKEAVRLRKECNLRDKRQDPLPKANDPLKHAGADLRLQERKRRSQTLPIRVRTANVGRQAQNQAEKFHPTKYWWQHRDQAPLRGRNEIAIVLAIRRSVGELTANNRSTGDWGAKCQ